MREKPITKLLHCVCVFSPHTPVFRGKALEVRHYNEASKPFRLITSYSNPSCSQLEATSLTGWLFVATHPNCQAEALFLFESGRQLLHQALNRATALCHDGIYPQVSPTLICISSCIRRGLPSDQYKIHSQASVFKRKLKPMLD